MFNLKDQPMRMKYYHPSTGVVDAGAVGFDQDWYDTWLDSMVKSGDDVIFFIVVDTTDIFEKEWDFNEVAMPRHYDASRLLPEPQQYLPPNHL